MGVQLRLLGVPHFTIDGHPVRITWPRRSLALLAYMFAARGLVSRDVAAFALWPDDDVEDARANLRRNLNLLRTTFPPAAADWIVVESGAIGFDHAAADTDVAAFEALAADPAMSVAAAQLYGGEFCTSLYDAWVLFERERLTARYHELLIELIGEKFSARRFDEALHYARQILADEPFREDIVRRTIAIHYAKGDRPGALAQFERFRRALELEMGLEPMPETRSVYELVLRGDPLPAAPDAHARAPQNSVAAFAPAAASGALLPFGGRAFALEQLSAHWAAASTGQGKLVFVAGEAGIGKTRIVAELLERSVGASARILRGTTASPEARPFEAVLGALAQATPFLASLQIEPVWLNVVATLIPEIGTGRGAPAIVALPPERETMRLFEAFARILTAVARARPVVMVLEDVHWADPSTLAAIRHLAVSIRGSCILIIVTYRDGDSAATQSLRREMCGSGLADAVVLGPLLAADALRVVSRLDQPLSDEDARLLVERSEGNPLFLTELVREYPQSLNMISNGIEGVVNARLARCSPGARALAEVASVCGSTFDLDLVRDVVGWSDGATIDGIAELLRRHFIRSTANHERGGYTFTHALVRSSVESRTTLAERKRVHHMVARALEARSTGTSYVVEIARHWQAADEFERAAHAYGIAAKASLAAHARDEAALLATAGESLTTDPRLRFTLITLRVEANLRRTAETQRDDVRVLTTLAESLDETARYEAAMLAYSVEEIEGDGGGIRRCVGVLRGFVDATTPPRRLGEIADVEAKEALFGGDLSAAIAAAERAEAHYREAGARAHELRAAIFVARMQGRLGNIIVAQTLLEELAAPVAALAESYVTIEYWSAQAGTSLSQHDSPGILRATEQLRNAARDAGDRLTEGHAAMSAGIGHSLTHRLTQAFTDMRLAIDIYASLGATIAARVSSNNYASLLMQVGRIAEAAEILTVNLEAARSEGKVESQYFAANNLGVARLAAGAIAQSLELQRFALQCAHTIGSDAFAALALGDLGAAETASGDIAAGVGHLVQAAAMNAALNRPAARAYDLARAADCEPHLQTAATYAREALAIVEANADDVARAPEILALCARAFERGNDPAAEYTRRRGRTILERHAAAIEDLTDRRYFCRIPHHAALLAPDHSGSESFVIAKP